MSTKLLLKYQNRWVALSADRKKIITSAKSIKALDARVKRMNQKDVIYHHVLPLNGYYSP